MSKTLEIALLRQRDSRLIYDRTMLHDYYPKLRFHKCCEQPRIEGQIVLSDGLGPPVPISVHITFPPTYPRHEPRIYEVGERFPHIPDRHFYNDGFQDGRCCLWHELETQWDPHNMNALIAFLDQASIFFDRQLTCDATGIFPGPQRLHGVAGRRQAIANLLGGEEYIAVFGDTLLMECDFKRNEQCPCGQSRKYKKCHLPIIQKVRSHLTNASIREAIYLELNS